MSGWKFSFLFEELTLFYPKWQAQVPGKIFSKKPAGFGPRLMFFLPHAKSTPCFLGNNPCKPPSRERTRRGLSSKGDSGCAGSLGRFYPPALQMQCSNTDVHQGWCAAACCGLLEFYGGSPDGHGCVRSFLTPSCLPSRCGRSGSTRPRDLWWLLASRGRR